MKTLMKKDKDAIIFLTDKTEVKISSSEYHKLDKLLEMGKTKGCIRTKDGTWINLSYFTKIELEKSYWG